MENELFVTDCLDDARYVVMRFVRLVITVASEVGAFGAFVLFARAGMWLFLNSFGDKIVSNTGKWYYDVSTNYPLPAMGLWILAFSICWVMMYAVGMPYRTQTEKPGMSARRCHKCRIAITDDFHCSNCKVFRPQKLLSLFLQFLSRLVSWMFTIHDVAAGLFSMALGRK